MTPLDMPEKIESNEYIDPNLRDLQTKIVDYRLELLLGGIKMIKREIEGTDVPYNRDAKMEDGIINIIILPKLRGESSRPARKEGIVAEKLFFDTAGNAVLEREIEGVIYKVIINNANGVGTMTLQKIGGTTPTETPAEEVTKTTEEKFEEPAAPDVTENKTDTLTWKGDLPEGATVRTDGPILIVEDKAGHEIGMFDMTGRDLSIRDQEYDGTFFGNIANPALYDLYVTNKGGKLLFEFEKRPFDETPFEKKIRGSAVPAGKEWTTYISNGEVGIVDINPGGRPVLIANLGVIDREKLHTTPREKTFFLPRGDIKVEAYYLEGKFEIEATQLATKSYVPPVEKKEPAEDLDKGSDDKVDASKEKKDTIPPVIDKKIEGLPGENVVDLAYGVRIKYGENGPEFGQYDMTVRTMDGKVLDQYYVDYYRQLTDERYFYIRRKEPTAIAIPFFKRKEFPNLPDLNRDDEMFALDIRVHELVDGGAWSYTDEEGDLWKVKVELDDKKILRVYVDAPLEKKKQKEEIRKKEEEKKLVINLPDEIVFPEFDNLRVKTAEQLEKIKQRLKDVLSDMYESDEPTFDKKDIILIPPAMQVSIEDETVAIKGISKHIYGLDPYTTEELENVHAIWLPKKGFKLRLVTSYFDKKLDKDLVEITLGKKVKKGETIEKDGWKVKVDVDANGILIVSAAPSEADKENVVKTDADIETRKLGFLWPTDEKKVNDRFGSRDGRHDGIDIATKVGSSIKAPHDGTIIFVGNGDGTRPGRGEMVVMEHSVGGKKYRTLFAHLLPSSTATLRAGNKVRQGDVFAKTGGARNAPGSGNSTGPHLHYEIRKYDPTYIEGVWKNRRPVDPLDFYDKNRQSIPVQQPTVTPQNAPTQTPTPPNGQQQNPPANSTPEGNTERPDVVPKVINIPASQPPVKLGDEEKKIGNLLNIIKNFGDTRYADLPDEGRQAGYENNKFVLIDERGNMLFDLDQIVYKPGAFTYNPVMKMRETVPLEKTIKGEKYSIKVVIRSFGTMSVRMNLLSY